MANSENLKPPINKRSTKEQREIRKKGGIKSGEKRRERKKFKELLEIALQLPNEESGEQNDFAIIAALIKKAANGDTKAFELIRDTIGEKPTDKQEITGGLEIQKVFITEKEQQETDKHIDDVINEQ